MDQVEREVRRIVSRVVKVPESQLTRDTDLRVDLNVDSLQGLQIVAAIEKEFALAVPNEELDFYSSVGAITDTLKRLQGAQVSSS
jgi:acyl carrier protein